jgi:hypothetical protein
MKIERVILISALLIVVTAACSVEPIAKAQDTQTVVLPTITFSFTLEPTKSIITETPSPKPSVTNLSNEALLVTQTPIVSLTYRCLDILSTPPSDATLDGTLVIPLHPNENNNSLLDFKTGTQITLGIVHHLRVSPDQKKLAYLSSNPSQLVVTDLHGKPLVVVPAAAVPINPEADRIVQWLDNERLLIEKRRFIPFKEPYKSPSLLVYNPNTGEKQEFLPEDYPIIYKNPSPGIFVWAFSSYLDPDPTLTRMVYQAETVDDAPIILWDISKGEEITRVHNNYNAGSTPIWLPDGSHVIVVAPVRFTGTNGTSFDNLPGEPSVGGEEILIVSRDGKLKRLTNLTKTNIAHPGAMSLSPDGRYIAYWLIIQGSQYPGERLAVVDTLTGQVMNYCIAGFPDPAKGYSNPPIWSPDGKFLAITVPDPKVRFQTNALVVDTLHGYAYKVADNVPYIGGWMSNSP